MENKIYFPEAKLNRLLTKYKGKTKYIRERVNKITEEFNKNPDWAKTKEYKDYLEEVAEVIYFEHPLEGIDLDTIKDLLSQNFKDIQKLLRKYLVLEEDYYTLIPIWIIGTWFHKYFETYPYLYFNATKGSGKSRILKLIKNLVPNGKQVNNISDSVMFRTAKDSSFCIDEFEFMSSKEKSTLLLLLNSAYKKGTKVERMNKIKTLDGEKYGVEEFEVYCPIVIANIWGLDNTLEDRCISLILEKSFERKVVKLIEDFEQNSLIKGVIDRFLHIKGSLGSLELVWGIQKDWNNYIENGGFLSDGNNNSLNSHNSTNYYYSLNSLPILFKKIDESNISGRDLELFMPLFIISELVGNTDELIEIAKRLTGERKDKDLEENLDVQLINYVSNETIVYDYLTTSNICTRFRNFLNLEEKQSKFINSRWMGKALKRLSLIKDKKKAGSVKIMLDVTKAKEKMESFK